ncbi:MAG: IS1595 family transposase [Chloroflexi bacterium]|nr:IS1595 family transposase [Chloroflexota bacterium]MYD48243.1 IS1595 family transposase [Chloroflexota bacterium]
MPNNRKMSVFELLERVATEGDAVDFLEECRWGDTPRCPRCASTNVARTPPTAPMPWRCPACRKYFNVRTNTVMAQSQIPLKKWCLAIYLFHNSRKGISALQLGRELGLTPKSARFLAMRIREAMTVDLPLLDGVVEADETYIGGKPRSKHAWQRERDREKREAGVPTRQVVMGIRQRDGKVVAFPIDRADRYNLQMAIGAHVEPGSTVYTDGHGGYQNMHAYNHDWVNHSAGEYVHGMAHTNSIESFWALLKRGYTGTFHFFTFKHLHRYVNEFAYRLNAGPGNDFGVIAETVLNMEGKRLTYKQLIGGEIEFIDRD